MMCQDIKKQRALIGGDGVVSQAIYTKEGREIIAKVLGEELTMFLLETDDPELQAERLAKRKREESSGEVTEKAMEAMKEKLKQYARGYDPALKDEQQVVRVQVSKETTLEDIINIMS